MDFISNLIKRPISLVLNDSSSSSATEHSQSPTKLVADLVAVSPSSKAMSTTVRISPDRPATPSSSYLIGSIGGGGSSLFTAAMNTSITANVTSDLATDSGEDYCDLPSPVSSVGDIKQTKTSPVNNNTSAIGELLLQINDNLNLAESLSNPTANDRSPITASASTSFEINTLPNKPTPLKLAPIMQPTITTPTPNNNVSQIEDNKSAAPSATPPPADTTTNIASTTVLKLNSPKQDCKTNNSFVIEKPLELDYNGVTNVFAQKFSGLAAFDEQNIPDLPDALNPDLEGNGNNKLHLLINHETDTASSDNETYVECQSYQEDLFENTINDLPSELGTEISGSEKYRSALNITSGGNSPEEEGILNATMENIPDIQLDEEKLLNSINSTLTPEKSIVMQEEPEQEQQNSEELNHVVFEDEPMDVDISYTEIEPNQDEANKTSVIQEYITPSKESVADFFNVEPASPVILVNEIDVSGAEIRANEKNMQQFNEVHKESPCTVSADELNNSKKRLTFTMSFAETDANVPAESNLELDTEQSTYEVTQNKSIELSKNQLFNVTMSPGKNSLMSPTLKLSAIVENDGRNTVVDTLHKETNEDIKDFQINLPSDGDGVENLNVSVKSLDKIESNLNLTLDMNSSCGSCKSTSSSNSSNFPLRTNNEDFKQFPRSPKSAEIEKKPRFLEKSEYAERLNCRKISLTELKLSPNSSTSAILNKSDEEKLISKAEQCTEAKTLNETTKTNNIAEDETENAAQKLFKGRRDTFFASPAHSIPVSDFPSPLIVNSDDGNQKVTLETMDIDETLPLVDDKSSSPGLPVTEPLVVEIPISAATPPFSCSPSAIPTRTTPNKEAESKIPVLPARSPPIPALKKRPPIHAPIAAGYALEMLSAKEQTQCNNRDEKDIVAEKLCTPSPLDDMLASSTLADCFTGFGSNTEDAMYQPEFTDDDFQGNNDLVLNPCDFDFLLTKGNNNINVQDVHVDRSSLLLRFDPLLGVPVPVNQAQLQQQEYQLTQQQLFGNNNIVNLSPTIEEDGEDQSLSENNSRSFIVESAKVKREQQTAAPIVQTNRQTGVQQNRRQLTQQKQQQQQPLLPSIKPKKHVRMSVDIIESNDCNKTFEHNNSTDENQSNYKMDELEKKIKNEVLKTEDIEKKLKEAEQREEALIKRITEKDKTISKMNGVVEAYEKAIAELISEKEQLKQNFEKQLTEVTADRDMNYHHLTSLETTFSDLHVKYEKSKEMTLHLKTNEESLLTEKRKILENLRAQEQRYDKMKNHAMQQLEIANKKLESMSREHSVEVTKLKALLKKEEISRASINEQLIQKSRENAELVKICDELINGQGS